MNRTVSVFLVLLLLFQMAKAQKAKARSNTITLTPPSTSGLISTADSSLLPVNVDTDLPKTAMRNPDAIAVVIGNTNYQKTKAVAYSGRDASSIRRYLVEVLGYKDGNIFFLMNATKSDFELYFGNRETHQGKLFNAIKPSMSDVFVYYSGHGAPGLKDKRGYIVPVECDPNYVEIQGYPLDVFYANIGKLNARSTIVVLDACFSGADLFDNISPITISIESPVFALKNGVLFCSSSRDQASSWYPETQHGMFTYFFLKAIHSRAADLNRDGSLTLDEIYRYVSDKTEGVPYYARRINGVEQIPTIQGTAKERIFVKY